MFNYMIGAGIHMAMAPPESLKIGFLNKCRQMDRPVTALLLDLKQRGLLDETLIVWGGEFGRTPMWENRSGVQNTLTGVGRDHQGEAFTMWMAGGGIKKGFVHGKTERNWSYRNRGKSFSI